MSVEEIQETYAPFPREAILEVMKVASELLDTPHVVLDVNMPNKLTYV